MKESMNGAVIGLGEALWDCLPEGRKIGGAPANFAYHVSQFGLPGVAVSAVGDDALGKELLQNFNNNGLNVIMPVVDFETGTVQVELDEKGVPSYDIKQGVAWDNIPASNELIEIARNAKAICFGSLAQRSEVSRSTIRKVVAAMPTNSLKVFDINLRQNFYNKNILQSSFESCNILKINDEELEIVTDLFELKGDTQEAKCKELVEKYGLDILILTCGVDGSYVFTKSDSYFQGTPKVSVADTVGAGDSFTGSFIAALLKGKSVEDAHKLAVDVSAYVCTQRGAMPKLTDELLRRAQ